MLWNIVVKMGRKQKIILRNVFQPTVTFFTQISNINHVRTCQDRSQPRSPGWARVPLSSFCPQISINFSYFSSNFTYFLPHFGPPGGRVAHPGRPWLRHWHLHYSALESGSQSHLTCLTEYSEILWWDGGGVGWTIENFQPQCIKSVSSLIC